MHPIQFTQIHVVQSCTVNKTKTHHTHVYFNLTYKEMIPTKIIATTVRKNYSLNKTPNLFIVPKHIENKSKIVYFRDNIASKQ